MEFGVVFSHLLGLTEMEWKRKENNVLQRILRSDLGLVMKGIGGQMTNRYF